MEDNFQLHLVHEDYELTRPIETYLNDQSNFKPIFDNAYFSFVKEGEEYLGEEHNFGQLNFLCYQLEEIIKRLATNKFALIRAADVQCPEAPYLLFEPLETNLLVSIVFFDVHYNQFFPIDGIVVNCKASELYDYASKNLEELVLFQSEYNYQFTRVAFPKDLIFEKATQMIADIQSFYKMTESILDYEIIF